VSATQSPFDAGAQRYRIEVARAPAYAPSGQYRSTILATVRDVAEDLEAVAMTRNSMWKALRDPAQHSAVLLVYLSGCLNFRGHLSSHRQSATSLFTDS
jgi:hypothetical protein